MQCPTCKKPMKEVRKDTSKNPRDNMEYSRTIYQCPEDDSWLTVEIPKVGSNKQNS